MERVSARATRAGLTVGAPGTGAASFIRALEALIQTGTPFLVGGGIALEAYVGTHRDTKDLDVFVMQADVERALGALAGAGFRTERPFPHWLAKAYADDGRFVDVIFGSGNGAAQVDAEWFDNAPPAHVLGVAVRLVPPEETLWSKAFVMERERFDGADVAHLILACGETLDWDRLMRRFGDHWPVLLAHLVLFTYVFPDEAHRVPRRVVDELLERTRREGLAGSADASGEHVCRGTLLSREQYLPDLARGWRDARLAPRGGLTRDAIDTWTEAIDKRR